ncbi:hypothetical protein GYA49_04530 [Candidatus Beckwithbacteria bacterium]|nr:hypothetical protein [Candidatus Beckwithbacteria bacterium]
MTEDFRKIMAARAAGVTIITEEETARERQKTAERFQRMVERAGVMDVLEFAALSIEKYHSSRDNAGDVKVGKAAVDRLGVQFMGKHMLCRPNRFNNTTVGLEMYFRDRDGDIVSKQPIFAITIDPKMRDTDVFILSCAIRELGSNSHFTDSGVYFQRYECGTSADFANAMMSFLTAPKVDRSAYNSQITLRYVVEQYGAEHIPSFYEYDCLGDIPIELVAPNDSPLIKIAENLAYSCPTIGHHLGKPMAILRDANIFRLTAPIVLKGRN